MHLDAVINKMLTIFDGVNDELGYGQDVVDKQLTRFATLSARVENVAKGELDFEFAQPTDSPEEIKAKFMRYIDTGCYRIIEETLDNLVRMDVPLTPREHAPEPLPADAPKK